MSATDGHGTLTLLTRLSKAVYRRVPEVSYGMSWRDFVALSYIADPGGISQQQLGEVLLMDANNTVLVLNALESRGLVRRVRDPADRRRHIVEVTAEGREYYDRAMRVRDQLEAEVLNGLDAGERATLRGLLAKALAAM